MTAPATYDCTKCGFHVVDASTDYLRFLDAIADHEEYHRYLAETDWDPRLYPEEGAALEPEGAAGPTGSASRSTSVAEGARTMRGLALAVFVCVGFWLIVGAVVLTLTTDRFDGRTLAAAALVVAGVGCWLVARVGSRRSR